MQKIPRFAEFSRDKNVDWRNASNERESKTEAFRHPGLKALLSRMERVSFGLNGLRSRLRRSMSAQSMKFKWARD